MKTIQLFFLRAIILFWVAQTVAAVSYAQNSVTPVKVHHAEPLYMDLVRDLGARKGEKELNVGADLKSLSRHNQYTLLAEYEFAPINRLGLEVEADFMLFKPKSMPEELPGNKLECLRFSAQYSFLVSEKYQATLALGYTQLVELIDFRDYGKTNLINGTVFSPFFVGAKRWGKGLHTLVYVYPLIEREFESDATLIDWGVNTSLLYSIPNSDHFVGIELNQVEYGGKWETTLRPQVKVTVDEHLALGLVSGIPMHEKEGGFSAFFRIIYEP